MSDAPHWRTGAPAGNEATPQRSPPPRRTRGKSSSATRPPPLRTGVFRREPTSGKTSGPRRKLTRPGNRLRYETPPVPIERPRIAQPHCAKSSHRANHEATATPRRAPGHIAGPMARNADLPAFRLTDVPYEIDAPPRKTAYLRREPAKPRAATRRPRPSHKIRPATPESERASRLPPRVPPPPPRTNGLPSFPHADGTSADRQACGAGGGLPKSRRKPLNCSRRPIRTGFPPAAVRATMNSPRALINLARTLPRKPGKVNNEVRPPHPPRIPRRWL
jgi:hypothetical protein